MLDGHLLVDAHLHAAALPTLKLAWREWASEFGSAAELAQAYRPDGYVDPAGFSALLAAQGVDHAFLFCEYSPKATGVQPIEDLLPVAAYDPQRFRIVANLNPHLHFPVEDEVQRQFDLGAVALKLHPVHGGFPADDRALYPAYERCRALGRPVVVHCGTSSFPGSMNRYGNPEYLLDVLRDFPGLNVVLAHGGRGWWYDAAAFLALSNPHVWIELSGLPPARLPHYYARSNFARLSRRFVFGTDWPGVPSIAGNARAVAALCPDEETVGLVLGGNARHIYLAHEPAPTPDEPAPTPDDHALPDSADRDDPDRSDHQPA